ncbi:class II glutamine amidotransferase [Litoreibacter sp.]|nr:class II glutamine amidotransferase [Litoreibacter sp.]
MCRLAAWVGAPIALEEVIIAPEHSLLAQSQDATEAKLAVNGDGFGITWYHDESGTRAGPGQYRDVLPAWSDGNLTSLCQMIVSPLFLAHVRASTVGETARVNCHPFRHGCWSFMHNGQLGGFTRIKRHLENLLPDELYHLRAGTTDSEMLFLLLLAHGLKQDPANAISEVLELLANLRQPEDPPHRITCVLSDGDGLYAFRHASDKKCPTLYQRRAETGVIVASEPLDGQAAGWTAVAPDTLLCIRDGSIRLMPFNAQRAAA